MCFRPVILSGIPVYKIASETMVCKPIYGLYSSGEVIDLHARTGCYNLQIANLSGSLAGKILLHIKVAAAPSSLNSSYIGSVIPGIRFSP